MSGKVSVIELLTKWPTRKDLAADLGVTEAAVNKWFERAAIPADRDVQLVLSARQRGISLTFEDLAKARAKDLAA